MSRAHLTHRPQRHARWLRRWHAGMQAVGSRSRPIAAPLAAWSSVVGRRPSVVGVVGLLALASLAALWPRTAWAACGPLDLGACVDNAEYSFYAGIAAGAWNVNRWLLLLAYQFDQLRSWLIDVAFTSAYQGLARFIEPAYIPVAVAALMLAVILFMLVPLTGETGFVSIHHVLVWAILTPLILTLAGQLIAQAEQLRSDVSAQLFTQVSRVAPGAIFGSPGSDMPAPRPLYPANPCGATLTRSSTGLAMDALAAALMYADAGDIHCPDARGPSRDIPDGFYNAPPAYAYDGYVGDLDSAVERRGWVEGMQRGMNRLLQGIIPSLLAVLESLIHLLFALSMAVLWLALPIGLLFVWFQQTAAPVASILRRATSILLSSWVASMVLGFLSAALSAAATLGNAGAYTGMALGGLVLLGYLVVVALGTLWRSIGAIEQTALSATGLSVTQPLQAAAQLATTTAAGVATGGAAYVGLAAMGSAAFTASAGAPLAQRAGYAAGAMAGRLPGIGAAGEVAAAMGWLATDSALYEGLYAGERSRHSWRSARLQLERDGSTLGAPAPVNSTTGSGSTSGGAPRVPALVSPPPAPPPPPVPPLAPAQPPQPEQLPATHPHRAAAAAQLPPQPNPAHGRRDWQYVGSEALDQGYRHTFRHPRHPLTDRPETRVITTDPASVAASPPPTTGGDA